jgi:hypothetical protein
VNRILSLAASISAAALSFLIMSANAQALTVVNGTVVEGTVPSNPPSWVYIPFAYAGGTLSINILANSYTGGLTGTELHNSVIYLFVDNGSAPGALTGTLVAFNEDSIVPGWDADGSTSIFDSYIPELSLGGGNYILAVGSYLGSDVDARSNNTPSYYYYSGDFRVTFTEASEVPLPAALPLFGSGLGALGLLSWHRKRKKAAARAA